MVYGLGDSMGSIVDIGLSISNMGKQMILS
jgi:hypothetical protein